MYCCFHHELLEVIKTEPLPLLLSSSVLPLPNQASSKPCEERIIPASIKALRAGMIKCVPGLGALRVWCYLKELISVALHNQLHHRHSVGESAECENPRRNSSQQTLEQVLVPLSSTRLTRPGQRKLSSQKPAKGQVPFLLWVGNKRAFVSKGFVPIGASQTSIASLLVGLRQKVRLKRAESLIYRYD